MHDQIRNVALPSCPSKVFPALALASLATFIVIIVRAWLLSRYSSSVPSWDAWGAEAAPLYSPWIDGTFQWDKLWAWHNEHRIFFTRVLDLLLFVGNEMQWDVRVQTLASSTMFATMTGMAVFWLRRHVDAPLSLLLCAVVFLAAVLPAGWANTYQGFQSCFYFVLLFALIAIRNAAQSRFSWPSGLVLAISALAAVFSLAAGVLVAVAGLAIVAVRVWLERVPLRRALALALPLLAVAIWALLDARKGEIHPATMAELGRALAIMLSWPFVSFYGMALWLPAVVVLAQILRRRTARTADLVFGGLSIWVLLICAAAAWARAYNFVDVQSRYTDLLIPSLVGQIYFAFRCAELLRARLPIRVASNLAALVFAIVSVAGLTVASLGEFWKWREYDFMTRIGATHVRAYLDGDAAALDGHPHGYIPYPEPRPLAAVLDSPMVRSYLPISISSLKQPVPQRSRSCRWRMTDDHRLPRTGTVSCESGQSSLRADSELSVGRFSALTYAIWERMGRQSYTRLSAEPALSALSEKASCALDQVNGVPVAPGERRLPYADVIRTAGWVGPQPPSLATPVVRVVLDGGEGQRYSAVTTGGTPRPEVAAFLGVAGYDVAGFNVVMDGSVIPAGSYRVLLANSVGAECNSGVVINLANVADTRLAY